MHTAARAAHGVSGSSWHAGQAARRPHRSSDSTQCLLQPNNPTKRCRPTPILHTAITIPHPKATACTIKACALHRPAVAPPHPLPPPRTRQRRQRAAPLERPRPRAPPPPPGPFCPRTRQGRQRAAPLELLKPVPQVVQRDVVVQGPDIPQVTAGVLGQVGARRQPYGLDARGGAKEGRQGWQGRQERQGRQRARRCCGEDGAG